MNIINSSSNIYRIHILWILKWIWETSLKFITQRRDEPYVLEHLYYDLGYFFPQELLGGFPKAKHHVHICGWKTGNANHHSVNLVITTSKILVKRFIQLLRSGFWSACSIINGNNLRSRCQFPNPLEV